MNTTEIKAQAEVIMKMCDNLEKYERELATVTKYIEEDCTINRIVVKGEINLYIDASFNHKEVFYVINAMLVNRVNSLRNAIKEARLQLGNLGKSAVRMNIPCED